MKWITATNLESWAETIPSRIALADLVGRLVRGTATDIGAFRFPSGDSAEVHGYDGMLTAQEVPPFIPGGTSVWEFGAGADFVKKANSDFAAKSAEPGRIVPSESTFVFLTPRRWNKQPALVDWVLEKKAANIWRDVRAIDGIALEDWFEQCPAVAAWFAREINMTPKSGARSSDEFWTEYSSCFIPKLTEKVLTCDREEQAGELITALLAGPKSITICADSLDEGAAFIVAAIRSAQDDQRRFLEARVLILDNDDAARQMSARTNMVFIVRGASPKVAAQLSVRNIVVFLLGQQGSTKRDAIVLNRPTTLELAKALKSMGFDDNKAEQEARFCGRSVTILQRRIPNGSALAPQWVDPGADLIPALLAGAWDDSSASDCAIVAHLANVEEYDQYGDSLRRYLRIEDPPIDREGSIWKIRASVDAFAHIGPLIGRATLERLRIAATEVFSDYDPILDLPLEEQPVVLSERSLKHSRWLREGLATSLLQIAVLHKEFSISVSGVDLKQYVNQIVEGLPGLSRDHRLIASLRNELPLLMEAAPSPLLKALEHLLEGSGARIQRVFEEYGAFSPTSFHTGLLWGLELLAWDPDYLERVTLILARLDRLDPGGRLSNRPINSLREIFLSWHPCTNAALDQRVRVLDSLIHQEPGVGWRLIHRLLPRLHTSAVVTAKPRYREAGASEKERLTWGLVFRSNREVVTRALALAGEDGERWVEIVKLFSNFEPALRELTRGALASFLDRASSQARAVVWSALQRELNRHKRFQTAEWSLKENELASYEALLHVAQPSDPIERVAWLFDEYFPLFPVEPGSSRRDAVQEVRDKSVREVYEAGGEEALLTLAERSKLAQFVASSAVNVIDKMEVLMRLSLLSLDKGGAMERFSIAISAGAERKFGREWFDVIVSSVRDTQDVARLMLGWRDVPETWKLVEELGLGASDLYWRQKQVWPLESDIDIERVMFAVRRYISVGRVTEAVGAITDYTARLPPAFLLQLLDACEEEIANAQATPDSTFLHSLEETFEVLRKRSDVDVAELARREYHFLPLLTFRDQNLLLHKLMAEEPALFVSILCDVFKPRGEARGEEPESESARGRARAGFQLLMSFQNVPGQTDGKIDERKLRDWILQVRKLAADKDRSEIADQYIGHILAHVPSDVADGAWPTQEVRKMVEDLRSDDVERGIIVERINMRGTYTKQAFEGGDQERELAREVRDWAAKVASWPRTSNMLKRLANSWEEDAGREDERARQDRMRFG